VRRRGSPHVADARAGGDRAGAVTGAGAAAPTTSGDADGRAAPRAAAATARPARLAASAPRPRATQAIVPSAPVASAVSAELRIGRLSCGAARRRICTASSTNISNAATVSTAITIDAMPTTRSTVRLPASTAARPARPAPSTIVP
jgi:hypothetical protein